MRSGLLRIMKVYGCSGSCSLHCDYAQETLKLAEMLRKVAKKPVKLRLFACNVKGAFLYLNLQNAHKAKHAGVVLPQVKQLHKTSCNAL